MLWSLHTRISQPSPRHGHNIIEFAYCLTKGGVLLCPHGEIPLRPGRTILIPSDLPHSYRPDTAGSIEMKILCLNAEEATVNLSPRLTDDLRQICETGVTYADHGSAPLVRAACSAITDGISDQIDKQEAVRWAAVSLLLSYHASKVELPYHSQSGKYVAKIASILRWIDRHLDTIISIDELAHRHAMSRSLLIREFRRHTGSSIVMYRNKRRTEKAAQLLSGAAYSVTQIAFLCGYSNLSHFHRQFKERYGLTPGAFRKQVETGAKDKV
ncbi:MAG: AraC family transcriptional regulator [Rhizomicrobium sp.]